MQIDEFIRADAKRSRKSDKGFSPDSAGIGRGSDNPKKKKPSKEKEGVSIATAIKSISEKKK